VIDQASPFFHVNENVQIAVLRVVALRRRPEDAYVTGAVPPSESKDRGSVGVKPLIHGKKSQRDNELIEIA
jgi:hypothetical protein